MKKLEALKLMRELHAVGDWKLQGDFELTKILFQYGKGMFNPTQYVLDMLVMLEALLDEELDAWGDSRGNDDYENEKIAKVVSLLANLFHATTKCKEFLERILSDDDSAEIEV